MTTVTVPARVLRLLIDTAGETLDDWRSGIADGTYEADLIGSVDAIEEAITTAEAAIVAPAPVYVIGVEGGVVQGMSTNNIEADLPRIIVCDWDARDDEGVQIGAGRADVSEPFAVLDVAFVDDVVQALVVRDGLDHCQDDEAEASAG